MRPSERLKEIETREYKDMIHYHQCREQDRTWLIERVKVLTEALEEIVKKCEVTGRAYPIARKALEEE
jgi:hypothetical protein